MNVQTNMHICEVVDKELKGTATLMISMFDQK